MHYGSLDRQASRSQLRRQPSSLTRQVASKTLTSGCCVHDESMAPSHEIDTHQHNKPKWQDSLRGSSTPSRKQSMETNERGRRSYETGTQSSRAKQTESENKSSGSFPPRRRSHSKPTPCRSSRSKSTSPDRLNASTYSSRAKQTDAFENETTPYLRKNSRSSKSPMRSRTNSTSSVHRRSKSPAKRSTSANNIAKRRSVGNFSDDCEDGPDPLAGYTSFSQFRAENSGQSSTETDRFQTTSSSSKVFASKKTSDSISTREELRKSSNSSSQNKASEYQNGHENTESYNGNGKKDSFNGNDYGITNSDFGDGKYGSYSKTTDRKGYESSYSNTSSYASNGVSNTPLSFPNGVGRTLSGAYKTNGVSPSSTLAETDYDFTQKLNMSRKSSEHKFESSGKISLGSLKKPSIESWGANRTNSYGVGTAAEDSREAGNSSQYRKGVSTTYIG